MTRLISRVTERLFLFVFDALSMIMGCLVRLLYWSVRTYGWGRVGSFFLCLWISIELHHKVDGFAFSLSSVGSILVIAVLLWTLMMLGYWWLNRWWQGRNSRTSVSSMSNTLPSCFQPIMPPLINPNLNQASKNLSSLSQNQNHEIVHPICSTGTQALWQQVLSPTNLREAWQRVLVRNASPGSDGVSVEKFALNLDWNLRELVEELLSGRYRPRPPRWIEVPKPNGKMRRLAILCVRDRIVQQALLLVLSPFWEKRFAPCSYAYRSGKSALHAVAAVEEALKEGYVWILDADIESFFDSVPHTTLFNLLTEWLPDEKVRSWVQVCVSGISPSPNQGLAQGAPLSPLLANLYLHRFDLTLTQSKFCLIRYADDFVILCPTRQQAEEALKMTEMLLKSLGLRLNADKTRIVHKDEGFTFLGYVFTKEGKRPSEEAISSLYERLSATEDEKKRQQILAGWQGYFGKASDFGFPSDNMPATSSETIEETDWIEPWWSGTNDNDSKSSHNSNSENLTLYRQRFLGRTDIFARYWQKDGRKGYAPVRREISDEDLQKHLNGQVILGTYLLNPDGTTKALVFDIDGPNFSEVGRASAFSLAQKIFAALKERGITPLLEDSGGKGFHLWLCLEQPVSAKELRQWAKKWIDQFRPFPDGILVEIFPKQDFLAPNALGSLLRLPLGLHPETNRFSQLLMEDGSLPESPWSIIASTPLIDPTKLMGISLTQQINSNLPEPPEAIAPMVKGCALIWGLVQKAAEVHHLRHMERLALLYTLGHCGHAGHNYLHQVISLCSNYNPRITERWLQRLDPGHRPIRCATLKEWLKDLLPSIACPCLPQKKDPTPLDLLRKVPKEAKTLSSQQTDNDLWEEIASEIFGEMLATKDSNFHER